MGGKVTGPCFLRSVGLWVCRPSSGLHTHPLLHLPPHMLKKQQSRSNKQQEARHKANPMLHILAEGWLTQVAGALLERRRQWLCRTGNPSKLGWAADRGYQGVGPYTYPATGMAWAAQASGSQFLPRPLARHRQMGLERVVAYDHQLSLLVHL